MDQKKLSHIQLWCPRPFGTYSQNKQSIENRSQIKKPSCKPKAEEVEEGAYSENTPPVLAAVPPLQNQVEEGRVLLDTWYVIKPGNTKEKVAFFVAHQCSVGGRASAVKVKGKWGNDSSKAKRRRRSHDPNSRGGDCLCLSARSPCCSSTPESSSSNDDTDLLSVADMVALVEQRTALALQNYSRPCEGNPYAGKPRSVSMVFASNEEENHDDCRTFDSNRVAEAVAYLESQERGGGVKIDNGLSKESGLGTYECMTSSQHSHGEVRISFRISSRDARATSEGSPNYMFKRCGGNGTKSNDKITCDLYQLVSPSRDTLTNNMEFLLPSSGDIANSFEGGSNEPLNMEMTDEVEEASEKQETAPGFSAEQHSDPMCQDCMASFHVDVVVTGVVDQCVFFGKDSTKNMKEETVCLTVGSTPAEALYATCTDPPPGQLFFFQTPKLEDGQNVGNSLMDSQNNNSLGCEHLDVGAASSTQQDTSDTSLCRLYRHVSHDFLEIRFKIQRLLEPRQYMLLLPDHIMVKIFSYLPTQSLAALKCSCHYFKCIIESYSIHATDSKWNRDPLYRDDPCKQCKKIYEKGDVSLCRWHPKPYHHDLPYGRSYWMCCHQTDKDTLGCRVGLHDNNWVQPYDILRDRVKREDGR
ncbi:hypothetical protein NDU88_003915 [Pleurodeles waltl]|uniref:F-box domain-containing protein n=1 Tax=Pleurodeles waltl TaxID=8319 RepID=A0AAV7MTL6_PLEWA|nr:hypothetical protein NDU88_003915 [Pleurodeles waltl]